MPLATPSIFTGVISFVGGADYEAANIGLQTENAGTPEERKYFNVVVRARESGPNGLTSSNTTIKVYLNNVNEAPTGAIYAVNAVSKDSQAGVTLATLQSVTDPDTQPASYTYALVEANGDAYTGNEFAIDANGNTAAARSWPLGTRLTVTNPQNGRSITVRINDRGPYGIAWRQGARLDLARGAARRLGMSGTQYVCVS